MKLPRFQSSISPSDRPPAARLALSLIRKFRLLFARSIGLSLGLAAAGLFPHSAQAVDLFKANNTIDLSDPNSWVTTSGGVTPPASPPTLADIAIWDSTVTAANTVSLGADLSWRGLRLTNPGGAVTIGGANTLTLGASGVDLSAATQNLTLNSNVALLADRTQTWAVGAGRTLAVNGLFTRGTNATINFDTSAGGTITLATGLASTLIGPYATLNKSDFAALDAAQNVVAGSTVLTYTPNPDMGAALPNMSGTVDGPIDVVNSNTNAISAFRLSNSLTITNGGIRFNTEHASGQDWVVDISTRNLNVGNRGILVTPAVGAKNVIFNGTGNIRLATGTELLVHQHNTAGDLIFNAQVTQPAGAGARLVKTGAGRLILAHSGNSYAGGTFVEEGTVQVGNGGTTGVLGAGDVINHGTLAFGRSDTLTVNQNIQGTGAVTQVGPGETILANVNTYSGPTNINGGTLTFAEPGNLGSGGTVNFNFNGGTLKWGPANTTDLSLTKTLSFNTGSATIHTNGNDVTFANPVGNGGAGALVKTGAGTLTLAAGNSYSGGTALNAGTLLVTNTSGSATGSGSVTVNTGGTLSGTGTIGGAVTIGDGGMLTPGNGGLGTLTVGGLTLSTGSLLTLEFNATPANDFVVVTGANGLRIDGGKLNLFNEGTTTPWTTLGTYNLLSFNGAIQGAGPGALSLVSEPAGFNYTFGTNGSFVTLTITTEGVIRNWIASGGGSWGNNANWNGTAPNEIGATANFGSSITAPSTVTLDGDKTVGAITFNSAQSYTIVPGSVGSLTLQKASGPGQAVVTSGHHTISAPVVLGSNLTAEVATAGQLTLSGTVSGTSRSLIKTGGGLLLLSGANSYSGGTQIDAGTIEFSSIGNLGTGGDLVLSGGALRWAAGNTTDVSQARVVTVNAGGATLDTNGNDVTFAGPIGNNGAGGLTKAGGGTLTLAPGNSYAGPTAITGGTLLIAGNDTLGGAAAGAGLTLNGGRLATASTFSLDNFGANPRPVTVGAAGGGIDVAAGAVLTVPGVISGSGALAKSGAGALLLTANNSVSFSGPVSLAEGEVAFGAADLSQSGLGSGPITFNGGTLTLNGHLGSTTPTYGTLTNALIVPAGQTGTVNMTQRGAMTGILSGAGTFNLKVNYVRGDVTANWSGFTGQINVTSTNTADGADDFRLAGFVPLNIPGAKLNLGEGVFMVQVFNPPNSGTFETVHNIGELSGAAGAFLSGGPVDGRFTNWSVGALNTDSTFAGTITNSTGQARLTKVGTGTLTLSGTSTYTGTTTVNEGTLLVTGSISGSTTTVNGGKFGGTGSVGEIVLHAGGAIEAGNTSDDFGGASLTWNGETGGAFAQMKFELSAVGNTSDRLSLSGTLSKGTGDTFLFDFQGGGAASSAYTLLTFGSQTGFSPTDFSFTNLAAGLTGSFDLQSNALVFNVVPEPASAAPLLFGGIALLSLRRRRRLA